jgi:methylamine dehydrogenase heavy chain
MKEARNDGRPTAIRAPILVESTSDLKSERARGSRRGNFVCCIGVALLFVPHLMCFADVPVDPIPKSLSLPEAYPDSWVVVYAVSQPVLGSYAIVDVAAKSKDYQGQFQGAFYSSLVAPADGAALYVAESFFASGGYGKRTDVVTVTQKSTLIPIAQIVMPGSKRAIMSGSRMDLTHDASMLLVLNFTPASSVTVVDIHKREVTNEIPIPGCTSIYPSGTRGFSSLCANGTLATFTLDAKGRVLQENRSKPFNDIDNDVLYMDPAQRDGIDYFITEKGNVRVVDMTSDVPSIGLVWTLITPEQVDDGWRTADGAFAAVDDRGNLYVRLHRETGYEKQLSDNTEVWVYDVATRKRTRRIPLKNGGTSIDVTRGQNPYLVVTAESDPGMGEALDVYEAANGKFVRTIGGWPRGDELRLQQARR